MPTLIDLRQVAEAMAKENIKARIFSTQVNMRALKALDRALEAAGAKSIETASLEQLRAIIRDLAPTACDTREERNELG